MEPLLEKLTRQKPVQLIFEAVRACEKKSVAATRLRRRVVQTVLSGLAGWLTLLAITATDVFSLHHTPDLGYLGFFVFWSFFLTFNVVVYSAFRSLFHRRRVWLGSLVGALLFSGTVPIWSLLGADLNEEEFIWHTVVAFVAGYVSFLVLLLYGRKCEPAKQL
jgi:Na+-driven multidrug efflux pump